MNTGFIGAVAFEKVSFEQYKKDFIDKLGEQFLADIDYLPYRISGGYDDSAVETVLKDIYDKIKLPKRSTSGSAGYDFFIPFTFTMKYGMDLVIPTGIKCDICDNWFLAVFPRSGIGFKYGVSLANTVGVIDSDYYNNKSNEGHIMAKLTNVATWNQKQDVTFNEGSAICQGILIPYGIVENDSSEGLRTGGFGSTN